uniref:Anaphase-promoting complex subunit 2 TPR repeats domain-containing protein n=1 Tax=Tanacetum cinerariifolium TaxID=118510 RepID=A0A699H3I8_TANCI|nr:hypothetical protein [Tanacetum cinerariifolium]
MTGESVLSPVCNLESEILDNWNTFCLLTQSSIINCDDASTSSSYFSNFQSCVSSLCKYGNGLHSLVEDHFLLSLQGVLEKHGAPNFWKNFDGYSNVPDLEMDDRDLIVSSVLMTALPHQFTEVLHGYFKGRLEELSTIIAGDEEDTYVNHSRNMDINRSYNYKKTLENIGMVVYNLRNLRFTSMTEDAYAFAIFLLLKAKVYDLAGNEYMNSVLDTKSPLASCPSSGDKPSERITKWQLRLEYFACLQDLRIAKLFEIIVDYPDSAPVIDDLKQCLEYTGQHSKLVDSFISSLRYRLLTVDASTNDIFDQYVSTIKALRTIDPTGVFLEAVGEPFREYLRGRKDIVKFIVTMLTDGTGGNNNGPGNTGDSLLEKLTRDEENQENTGLDDDINTDDKQVWIDIQGWEPDPIGAALFMGSRYRRKVDVLGMIVSIIGAESWKHEDEDVNIPEPMDHLLGDYAKRYHEIKTPRKLLRKKNLGTVKSLAAAIGLPVDTLQRRVNFWISKSSLGGDSNDHLYTLVDSMSDAGKTAVNSEEMIANDDAERSVASVEDQLRNKMVVYEVGLQLALTCFTAMLVLRLLR